MLRTTISWTIRLFLLRFGSFDLRVLFIYFSMRTPSPADLPEYADVIAAVARGRAGRRNVLVPPPVPAPAPVPFPAPAPAPLPLPPPAAGPALPPLLEVSALLELFCVECAHVFSTLPCCDFERSYFLSLVRDVPSSHHLAVRARCSFNVPLDSSDTETD